MPGSRKESQLSKIINARLRSVNAFKNLCEIPSPNLLKVACVVCVIYNILEKVNVASKTVLMNTDDLYSTLLVITPILQSQNTF